MTSRRLCPMEVGKLLALVVVVIYYPETTLAGLTVPKAHSRNANPFVAPAGNDQYCTRDCLLVGHAGPAMSSGEPSSGKCEYSLPWEAELFHGGPGGTYGNTFNVPSTREASIRPNYVKSLAPIVSARRVNPRYACTSIDTSREQILNEALDSETSAGASAEKDERPLSQYRSAPGNEQKKDGLGQSIYVDSPLASSDRIEKGSLARKYDETCVTGVICIRCGAFSKTKKIEEQDNVRLTQRRPNSRARAPGFIYARLRG